MSELADIIIGGGPYTAGQPMMTLMAGVVDVGLINGLRDELIRLRAARPDSDAACCEGRPAGHTGEHWPPGATHPAVMTGEPLPLGHLPEAGGVWVDTGSGPGYFHPGD